MTSLDHADGTGHALMRKQLAARWTLFVGLAFGASAGIVKVVFLPYPDYNPPAEYPALVAFMLSAVLWWTLIERAGSVTLLRGGIVGALAGLLTPILVWPIFGLVVSVLENRFWEPLYVLTIYLYVSLYGVAMLTAGVGSVLGTVLAMFRRDRPGG